MSPLVQPAQVQGQQQKDQQKESNPRPDHDTFEISPLSRFMASSITNGAQVWNREIRSCQRDAPPRTSSASWFSEEHCAAGLQVRYLFDYLSTQPIGSYRFWA